MRRFGHEHDPEAAAAVTAALGGALDKPKDDPVRAAQWQRRVALTALCESNHLLGRVVSTRGGLAWAGLHRETAERAAPLREGPGGRFAEISFPVAETRDFAWVRPGADAALNPRCRCGSHSVPTEILLAEVAAGTREVILDPYGVPVRRAR